MLSGDLARAQEAAKLQNVDQKVFETKMKAKNVVILDVRTPGEFKSGYIPGAINIDIYAADFQTQVQKLDKSKTYLVYCRSGARSSNAGNLMVTNGFKEVYNLQGGMMGWRGAVQR
ncbi:MAG: rhodanese-like domain-containing protein [Sphingobacteriaceae bacterium]|nr:rhodanese-like domain-containing protein [Sphingobacteriaceae bacterium]